MLTIASLYSELYRLQRFQECSEDIYRGYNYIRTHVDIFSCIYLYTHPKLTNMDTNSHYNSTNIF